MPADGDTRGEVADRACQAETEQHDRDRVGTEAGSGT
jgi:hypothetical protein